MEKNIKDIRESHKKARIGEFNGSKEQKNYTANACKMCNPLGASIAFKGIKNAVTILHGSQGCATYIRRYCISHFKEPLDIASSNFSEDTAIFGGENNLHTALNNVIKTYRPGVIAIASTCLSETIGDDVVQYINTYQSRNQTKKLPQILYASTPSYNGSHITGFHEANLSSIKHFAAAMRKGRHINLFPGFVSTEDIRHMKDLCKNFSLPVIVAPDYSETLDNAHWKEYKNMPDGGNSVKTLQKTADAQASIEFGTCIQGGKSAKKSAGQYLEQAFSVTHHTLSMPIGIKETDKFIKLLEQLSQKKAPRILKQERGRLVDAYIDGHKYLFGKKAVVFGDEDLVISLVSFLSEIGIHVSLAASGGRSERFRSEVMQHSTAEHPITARNNYTFDQIDAFCEENKPDILVGNSKGYYISRKQGVPIIRVGFPIHDRIGAQRISHLGYKGTQALFDRVVNALLSYKQEHSPVGYKYM